MRWTYFELLGPAIPLKSHGLKRDRDRWCRGHLFGTVSPTAAALNFRSAGEGF